MADSTNLPISYLWDELLKVSIFFQRPVIQRQFVTVVITTLLAWAISRWIWFQLRQRYPQLNIDENCNQRLEWKQYSLALIHYLSTPTVILGAVSIVTLLFEQGGWFAGYLTDSLNIIGSFWFYRLFVGSLFTFLPIPFVKRVRLLFLGPLFCIYAICRILSWFFNLRELAQVNVLNLFGEPILLKSLFISILGLYFWNIGVFLFENLLLTIFQNQGFQNSRIRQVVSLLLRYFLIGLGTVIIFGYVGVSPTAVAAISGGLSVGLGFGLKEVISNFVSGIWLLFEGALKPGDIIKINGDISKVMRLGVRATTVQVVKDNSEEIIPNQIFFTQNVSTLTGSNNLVFLSLVVGADYDCSPPKVIEVLLSVAHDHPQVLETPPPSAFALNFGDSSIDYELKFCIADPLMFKVVTSELICAVWQAFTDHGIEIPYPQRDLRIRSDSLKLSSTP
ncbi:mechanosensitive ion channel family protein [Leptothoe spongobia]|uniref:Mechanosensitive ion channel n=1 Tax=Leptothoe spongobia TAU-MAC 1115 TaxID=1967444 RepID=A0A947GHG1_9CYAN|nr:mechanosensitive ion channel domain-containing protein [Leptothoe spongobia]MBT9314022.1 mechanosensitive ion channel [Leptothoe spongobia TAU-MAC 1115]